MEEAIEVFDISVQADPLKSSYKAIKIAEQVKEYVDFIEAGTPLIKSVGLESVRKLKEIFPDKKIVADMKTADVGYLEVEMAANSGADFVSVLAAAPRETVIEALKAGKELNVKIMSDLIGIDNKLDKAFLRNNYNTAQENRTHRMIRNELRRRGIWN